MGRAGGPGSGPGSRPGSREEGLGSREGERAKGPCFSFTVGRWVPDMMLVPLSLTGEGGGYLEYARAS